MAAKPEKILVTGGAGFIGSHLIRLWLEKDPKVRIVNLDSLTYCGDLLRLQSVKKNPRYEFIRGNICDPAVVKKAMKGVDGVVHLAAESHVDRSLLDGMVFFETNTCGSYVLLEEARRQNVGRFVFVSTDEVYGSREKGFFKETDAVRPTSPYSVSKTAADLLATSYAHTRDMDVVVTRGGNTYGPYQYPEKVIPLFVANALSNKKLPLYGDGLQVRNWLHVEDHARAIIACYQKGKKGETYNIASGDYVTNIELTRRILTILNKPFSLIQKVTDRPGHDRRYAMDASKLKHLGWKTERRFEEALRDTVLWYRENEIWLQRIQERSADFKKYYAKQYSRTV